MTSTTQPIIALAIKHGASSYTNRADTQHPAYGFTEAALTAFAQDLLAGQCLHQIAEPAQAGEPAVSMLTFVNGEPAKCGCRFSYSDGGGEYSNVGSVTFCAKHAGHSTERADPFMWAIQEPGGGAYMDDGCVSSVREDVQAEVDGLNSGLDADDDPYQVVPVYLAAAPQAVQAAVPEGWKLAPIKVPDSAFAWVSGGYPAGFKAGDKRDTAVVHERAQRTWEAILNGITAPAHPAEGVPAPGEREAFEGVASDNGKWPKAVERDAQGNYRLAQTASGWRWWQDAWRARAALAATLPAAHGVDAQDAAPQPPEATTSAHSRQMCGAAPKVEPSAVSNGSWPDAPPQENIREGAPYDNLAFEQLARDMGVWGTPQAALCAQFWLTAQRSPLDRQQIQSMIDQHVGLDSCDTSLHHLARAVEHAHGIQAQRHGQ